MEELDLKEIFWDDNYSIHSVISKTKQSKSTTNDLLNLLVRQQQHITQTSYQLFNKNYDKFLELSYIITCLGEPLQQLINPLEKFRQELSDICQSQSDYLNEINTKLAALESVSINKMLARRLIELIRRRDRINKQLENIDWSQCQSDSDDHKAIIHRDLLERIKIQLHYLTTEVSVIHPTDNELITIHNALKSSLHQLRQQIVL